MPDPTGVPPPPPAPLVGALRPIVLAAAIDRDAETSTPKERCNFCLGESPKKESCPSCGRLGGLLFQVEGWLPKESRWSYLGRDGQRFSVPGWCSEVRVTLADGR